MYDVNDLNIRTDKVISGKTFIGFKINISQVISDRPEIKLNKNRQFIYDMNNDKIITYWYALRTEQEFDQELNVKFIGKDYDGYYYYTASNTSDFRDIFYGPENGLDWISITNEMMEIAKIISDIANEPKNLETIRTMAREAKCEWMLE